MFQELSIFSALDIGSNAARLFFGHVLEYNGQFVVQKISLLRVPTRLGEDVYTNGNISPTREKMLIQTINIYKNLLEIYKPEKYAIFATAALREAKNATKVLEHVTRETGMEIEIIDGMTEAALIRELYAQNGQNHHYKLLADLGGGSLELSLISPDGSVISDSFKIGAVRMLTHTVSHAEFERLYLWLRSNLPANKSEITFIGTGGNINAMKSSFSLPTIPYLTIEEIKDIIKKLEPLSVLERIIHYRLRPDRADVIVPAAKIFYDIMQFTNIQIIHVPGGGLVDAIALHLYKKKKQQFVQLSIQC